MNTPIIQFQKFFIWPMKFNSQFPVSLYSDQFLKFTKSFIILLKMGYVHIFKD